MWQSPRSHRAQYRTRRLSAHSDRRRHGGSVADVVAGHADVGAVTAASPVPEIAAGRLRSIGISSPARLPGVYAEVPTRGGAGLARGAVGCGVGGWRGV